MSLVDLLSRGVNSVLDEPEVNHELSELVTRSGLPEEAREHIRQTLRAMPGLLASMQMSLTGESVGSPARAVFATVVAYLLEEDDLIPSHAGLPLLGLLDDVYFLHAAACALKDQLGRVDTRSVVGGAKLLEDVLPSGVTSELRTKLNRATAAAD